MLASYLHDLDPVLFQFTEKIAIRWYGLAYVLAFVVAFLLLKKLSRHGRTTLPEAKLSDFITYTALFGVLLGGRLGYMLLYSFDAVLENPLTLFKLWEGGMSSHGGMIGITVFAWFYSRKQRVSWTGLGDDLVLVAPIGLFFGRIANYINGELFGRVVESDHPWAVRFPTEAKEQWFVPAKGYEGIVYPSGSLELAGSSREIVERSADNPELAHFLSQALNPRHPSQLYEAFTEGLFIFLILLAMRLLWPKLRPGITTATFFLLYAPARIVCENYRLPDFGHDPILGMTKGQFYSVFLFLGGVVFLILALRGWDGKVFKRGDLAAPTSDPQMAKSKDGDSDQD